MSWYYRNANFPEVYTQNSLLRLLEYKPEDFKRVSFDKISFYKKDRKLKKDGVRIREIYKPEWDLKLLQKRLNKRLLSKLQFPPYIHCGPKGRSVVTAAKGHSKYKHHRALDVDSFFDNITEKTVRAALATVGFHKTITNLIVQIAVEDDRLPQGFATSSLLSALVISISLEDFYSVFGRDRIILSVYADDIMVSSNNRRLLGKAESCIRERLRFIGLNLNDDKREISMRGGDFTWLGLRLHPWVTIPRQKLINLQKEAYDYTRTGKVPINFKQKRPGNRKMKWKESVKGKTIFARSISQNKLQEKILDQIH